MTQATPLSIQVTVLAENTAGRSPLLGEHGLAWWVQTPHGALLMDTGQGMVLEHNARQLGIDLTQAQAIVLSHGHYDHTGGLKAALQAAPQAKLFMHPAALERKFTKDKGRNAAREIGLLCMPPQEIEQDPRRVATVAPTQVLPGVWATGPVPRQTTFEDTGGPFFLDPEGTKHDPLTDDQSLYFMSEKGLVVLLGCAHSGVINTLNWISRQTGEDKIHALLGGMHLVNASPARIQATVETLARFEPQLLAPGHCTGAKAVARLWAAFEGRCAPLMTGATFNFPLQKST